MTSLAIAQLPPGVWIAPQDPFGGGLPAATDEEKALAKRLEAHVRKLAIDIGPRHVRRPRGLEQSVAYLTATMKALSYEVREQAYESRGVTVKNLHAVLAGIRSDEEIVVGAHYDSAGDTPAANDNGSGVAALLEMARVLKDEKPSRSIRFVFFVNEEPPFFHTREMGSDVYARQRRAEGAKIVGMVSLETIGYYADAAGTQKYPPPFDRFFPSQGNFIAFVGDTKSQDWVQRVITSFRQSARFPSQAIAAPAEIEGIGFSDQSSFWEQGYPALMVTDTAMFRYPHYHTVQDTPDKIDYDRMSRVVAGVTRVVRDLASAR